MAGALADFAPNVVIDPLGDGFTAVSLEALAPGGRLVLFGTSAGPEGRLPLQALYRKGLTIFGYGGLREPEEAVTRAKAEALSALADGRLRVRIDASIPLTRVNDALLRLADGGVQGKVVLDLSS